MHNYKILVIQGPNMNLIGLCNKNKKTNITLEKLNKYIRKLAKEKNFDISIFQTNSEGKAINKLQKTRKKIVGILLFLGPWQQSGYAIKETLEILSIPYITISNERKSVIFKKTIKIKDNNVYSASEKGIEQIYKLIN